MKKVLRIAMLVLVLLILAGCGKEGGTAKRQGSGTSAVNDVINAQIEASGKKATEAVTPTEKPTEKPAETPTETPEITPAVTPESTPVETPEITPADAPEAPAEDPSEPRDVDVDITELSATMVYSEVFGMMSDPDRYMGKIIKMKGIFSVYHDDYTGIDYYYCIIKDATACCAQGMEFTLEGCSYPDDYPEEGMEIVVMGEYTTYLDGGALYCTLKDATLLEAAFE